MLFTFSTPVLIRRLWQLNAVVYLQWCLIHAVLLLTKMELQKCQTGMILSAKSHLRQTKSVLKDET